MSFLALLALLLSASVFAHQHDEAELPCECLGHDEDRHCCDGYDYYNPCSAACDGFMINVDRHCTPGMCQPDHEDCDCKHSKHHPYCCDGEDYESMCEAKCDDFTKDECETGECDTDTDSQCHCKRMKGDSPVCCKGEHTFESMCEADCAGYKDKECEEDQGKCGTITVPWLTKHNVKRTSKKSGAVVIPSTSADSFAVQIAEWWISAHPLLVCFVGFCGLAAIATVAVRVVKAISSAFKKKKDAAIYF